MRSPSSAISPPPLFLYSLLRLSMRSSAARRLVSSSLPSTKLFSLVLMLSVEPISVSFPVMNAVRSKDSCLCRKGLPRLPAEVARPPVAVHRQLVARVARLVEKRSILYSFPLQRKTTFPPNLPPSKG